MLGPAGPLQAATDRSTGPLGAGGARLAAWCSARAATGLLWLGLAFAAVLMALAAAREQAVQSSPARPAAAPGLGARSDLAGLAGAPLVAASQAMGARDHAFHVRVSGAGYVAVNRPQGLVVHFDSSGVTLRSGALRESLGQPALGATARASVARVAPKASANLVTYADAGVRASYANGPLRLEPGFVLG